jgi:hypothetical protein
MPKDEEKISAYLSHIQSWLWSIENLRNYEKAREINEEEKNNFAEAVSLMAEHFGPEKTALGIIERMRKDIHSLEVRISEPLHSFYGGDEKIMVELDPLEIGKEFREKLTGYGKCYIGKILVDRGDMKTVCTYLHPLFAFREMWKILKEKHPEVLNKVLKGIKKDPELHGFFSARSGKDIYPFFKDWEWKDRPWDTAPKKELFEKVHGLVDEFRKTTVKKTPERKKL